MICYTLKGMRSLCFNVTALWAVKISWGLAIDMRVKDRPHCSPVLNHSRRDLLNVMDFEYLQLGGLPRDHVSERILEKDQLEAEIWPFWQTYLISIQKGNFTQ